MQPLEQFYTATSEVPFGGAELRTVISIATAVGEAIARSPEVANFISWLKIIGIILTAILAFGILVLIIKMNIFAYKVKSAKVFLTMAHPAQKEKISKEWERVKARLRRGNDADDRLAVIEADQILDAVLKRIGFKGNNMGERLENVKAWQLPSIQDVWNAHKIRNRLVHEPQTRLTHYEAETAVKIFEKALKELNFLD